MCTTQIRRCLEHWMRGGKGDGTSTFFKTNVLDCYQDWHFTSTLTPQQQSAIELSGVDISDTSKISELQWAGLCPQFKGLPEDAKKFFSTCSPKMSKVFEAAKAKCPTSGGNSGGNNGANGDALVCESVKSMVR